MAEQRFFVFCDCVHVYVCVHLIELFILEAVFGLFRSLMPDISYIMKKQHKIQLKQAKDESELSIIACISKSTVIDEVKI